MTMINCRRHGCNNNENRRQIQMTQNNRKEESIIIPCEDKYEAQKLASLILVKDTNTGDAQTFIKTIVTAIKNEVVISLVDGSSHSILLKDESAVESFADFMQSIIEHNHQLNTVNVQQDDDKSTVKISKMSHVR